MRQSKYSVGYRAAYMGRFMAVDQGSDVCKIIQQRQDKINDQSMNRLQRHFQHSHFPLSPS